MRVTTMAFASVLALATAIGLAEAQKGRAFAWESTLEGNSDADRLRWPVAVAGSGQEIAVADVWGPRLVVFANDGTGWRLTRVVSLPSAPFDIAHDGERYLVSLRGKGLVAVEGDRHQLRPIPLPQGAVPGALCSSSAGGFFVHDLASGHVHRIDAGGQVRPFAAVEGFVTGLAEAPGGGFYAAVPDQAAIERFGANGESLGRVHVMADGPIPVWPVDLVAEPGGYLFVVDRHAGRLLKLGPSGNLGGTGSRRGWGSGLLRFPSGIALLDDDRVAVADEGNGRVQIFRRLDEQP